MPRHPQLYHWQRTLTRRFPKLPKTFIALLALWTLGMILARRTFHQNIAHARAIMFDLATAGSISAVAGRANERRPRWHRLPYGVPLCIGFVGYLWFAGFAASQPPQADGRLDNSLSIVSIAHRAGSPEFSTFLD